MIKTIVKKVVKQAVARKPTKKKVVRKVVVSRKTNPSSPRLRRMTSSAKRTKSKKEKALSFERFEENPIITPNSGHHWESKATFNPAALFEDGKVHLLYRAIGDNDASVLGYAVSSNGFDIDVQLPNPAYTNHGTMEHSERAYVTPVCVSSGGGWSGGCEDPRLTRIGNRVFLLYTAFDGWGSIRMALTSISLPDFCNRNWKWNRPVFISPPNEVHKNWVLFPEKINGKYAILHSISPFVLVDYVGDLKEFDGTKFINSYYHARSGRDEWDNWVRGAGPTPIKTKHGWLVLYHAMDDSDPNRYKLGAMLLDLKDPTKVLYRAKAPFLEPDECYENEGFKAGVIYCCGAVISGDRLLIYYGGADTVTCVASVNLEEFLKELTTTGKPTIKKKSTTKRVIKKKI